MPPKNTLPRKQQEFVRHYLRDLNAAAAYRRAGYAAQGNSAEVNAARLLRNAQVAAEIEREMQSRAQHLNIRAEDVLRRLWDIATADPREIVSVAAVPCPNCWQDAPYRDAPNPDCRHCCGKGKSQVVIVDLDTISPQARALLARVKQTKYGVEVEFHDQLAALEKVARHLGMFNDKLTLKGEPENPLQLLIQQVQGSTLRVVGSTDQL
ncbi:terminase small subunit [Rhodoblastus sp. 17X3]|uniref:terminase small subunit n=1 Tax=Rhodoblastus sp. 17X3 TaxID=3047026 RepID=UPI0024B7861B|nr:terminase small subunit [Rhodoblastus sp. 17X3]MDI9846738.1 terminase small subunit [Rhodoblastus sp. 17X3]